MFRIFKKLAAIEISSLTRTQATITAVRVGLVGLAVALATTSCVAPAGDELDSDEPADNEFAEGKTDSGDYYHLRCRDAAGQRMGIRLASSTPNNLSVRLADKTLLALPPMKSSLNVRPSDDAATAIREFVEFNAAGLETIAPNVMPRIELDLAGDAKSMRIVVGDLDIAGTCRFNATSLRAFLALRASYQPATNPRHQAVGFDIDDTLMFTTPTFVRGFVTGGSPKPDDVLFWTYTNGCDAGCTSETITLADGTTKVLPSNVASTVKTKAMELVAAHRALGHDVYAITARPDINGAPLQAYVEATLGIPASNVYFEPDLDQPGNPAGKQDRMAALKLDVFYGDSDSDITDARKVTSRSVQGVRFFRSPLSSNRKDGKLNKYHPGYFGEPIVADSY